MGRIRCGWASASGLHASCIRARRVAKPSLGPFSRDGWDIRHLVPGMRKNEADLIFYADDNPKIWGKLRFRTTLYCGRDATVDRRFFRFKANISFFFPTPGPAGTNPGESPPRAPEGAESGFCKFCGSPSREARLNPAGGNPRFVVRTKDFRISLQ